MWMDIAWGLYFQVVGTHKHYMSSSKFFLPLVVGALKPSITFVSLPSLSLAPLAPLTLSHSPCSLSPLAPTEVVGTPKHSITYPYPTLAIGSEKEWEEARGEREGASWEGPLAQQSWWASQNLPPQVVGTPKHTPQSPLCPTSAQSIVSEGRKLGARGGTLGSREVVGTAKIGPTGGRDPKTYPLISITPYLPLAPPCPLSLPGPLRTSWGLRKPWEPLEAFGSLGSSFIHRGLAPLPPPHPLTLSRSPLPLSLPGPLGPSWGLRKPWEPLEAFGSLGSSVRLRRLASLASPHPLTPSHSPLPPEPPWDLPGASGSLGSLQKPSAALGLQSDSGALLPLLPSPPCSLSLCLTPWVSLGLSGPLGPFWGLRKPWEPMEAFGSLGSSVRLGGLASPHPPCSPLPPEPSWASLDPWDLPVASGSLRSLRKPLAVLGLQSDSEALLPLLPLTPPCSLSPPLAPSHYPSPPEPPWASLGPRTFLGLQKALGAFVGLWQPWVFSQTQVPCFPSSPLAPSHSPLSPEPPWAPGTFLGPQEALGAFSSLGCFCPKIFWPMMGTHKGLLQLCEWTLGGDCTSRWWGHISTICNHRSSFCHWWWGP